MSWHRYLAELERQRRREEEQAERIKQYGQTSDDELLRKRTEVEATLESLKLALPDWDVREGLASSAIRDLEKRREAIILTLTERGGLSSESRHARHDDDSAETRRDEPAKSRQ